MEQKKLNELNVQRMTGACIELDFEKINKLSEKTIGLTFFDLEYSEEDNNSLAYNSRVKKSMNNKEKFNADVKFKYKDWEGEQEFRALYSGKEKGIDISNCIKRIYLGEDFQYEYLKEICKLLSSKRYKDITPDKFSKLMVNEGGLILNSKHSLIDVEMYKYIKDKFPSYYQELLDKNSNIDDRIEILGNNFYKHLKEEQNEFEEIMRFNSDYWKDKYFKILEEKEKLDCKYIELSDKYVNEIEKNDILANKDTGALNAQKTGTDM